MKITLLFLSIMFLLFSGCRETEYSNPFDLNEIAENSPAIVSMDSIYTYSVNAKNYYSERTDALFFQKDSLLITIVISGYQSGSCDIFIFGKSGENLFSEYSNGNKTVVLFKKLNSLPNTIKISQTNLTAKVSIVLTLKK